MNKYKRAMENLEFTPEMEQRILKKLNNRDEKTLVVRSSAGNRHHVFQRRFLHQAAVVMAAFIIFLSAAQTTADLPRSIGIQTPDKKTAAEQKSPSALHHSASSGQSAGKQKENNASGEKQGSKVNGGKSSSSSSGIHKNNYAADNADKTGKSAADNNLSAGSPSSDEDLLSSSDCIIEGRVLAAGGIDADGSRTYKVEVTGLISGSGEKSGSVDIIINDDNAQALYEGTTFYFCLVQNADKTYSTVQGREGVLSQEQYEKLIQ